MDNYSKIWYEIFEIDYCINNKYVERDSAYFEKKLHDLFLYCRLHNVDINTFFKSQCNIAGFRIGNIIHYLLGKIYRPRYYYRTDSVNYIYTTGIVAGKYAQDVIEMQKFYNHKCQYLHLLYIMLLHVDNNILHDTNFYHLTPLQSCITHANKADKKVRDKLYNASLCLLLKLGKTLLVIQQSYVRRFLAHKKMRCLRLRAALLPILLAPPYQIEHWRFSAFPGGYLYHNTNNRFKTLAF